MAGGEDWGGCRERLSLDFAGAKTNRRLSRCRFEAGHGRHESVRTAASGIIEKSGGYFAWEPGKCKRKPLHHVLRTAARYRL